MTTHSNIVIIGSGIGGATIASSLADSTMNITILERGDFLLDCPQARDDIAIFKKGYFRPKENWIDKSNDLFNPGNYYYVGGNSKFYGAVMLRFREADFAELKHIEGISPKWPIGYSELAPWYQKAESLYQVRGVLGEDPTEPYHSGDYLFEGVRHEKNITDVKNKLKAIGMSPSSLPLSVNIDKWMERSKSPWDAFPDTTQAKVDGEYILREVLNKPNVNLITRAKVTKLVTNEGGNNIKSICYQKEGGYHQLSADIVILSAGAVNSAALLLSSANNKHPKGLANKSNQVGRNFMNHNCTAMLAINPFKKNTAIYQKTLQFNDFYLSGGPNNEPLGNMQLLGKVSANILMAQSKLPKWAAKWIANHSVDWYAMSEDLPKSENRVTIKNNKIKLSWIKSNQQSHQLLVKKSKQLFKRTGYPFVLTKAFDKNTPSHQCGTIKFGDNPSQSPLNSYCQTYQHDNLFVVDASFFPSSAAVNPSLTIAAQALRVADYIKHKGINND